MAAARTRAPTHRVRLTLGELGDDPNRYGDAKSRKNDAGTSPITKASGTRRVVLARYPRNRRLADACYLWAFAALTASPGARAYYDQRRGAGDSHHRALRALADRLVGILHGSLRDDALYDEDTAWGSPLPDGRLTRTARGMSRVALAGEASRGARGRGQLGRVGLAGATGLFLAEAPVPEGQFVDVLWEMRRALVSDCMAKALAPLAAADPAEEMMRAMDKSLRRGAKEGRLW